MTKGSDIPPQEFDATARQKTLGRDDTRFTGINADNAGESPEYDPSDTGINGAYVAALHDWLEQGLGYATELNYWPSGPGINQAWDRKHRPPGGGFGGGGRKEPVANTAADLGMAMRENPHLKVYSLNGVYDMATPSFGTEYDIAHIWLDPSLRGNVRFGYYPSGHMVYLNQDALKTMKATWRSSTTTPPRAEPCSAVAAAARTPPRSTKHGVTLAAHPRPGAPSWPIEDRGGYPCVA